MGEVIFWSGAVLWGLRCFFGQDCEVQIRGFILAVFGRDPGGLNGGCCLVAEFSYREGPGVRLGL